MIKNPQISVLMCTYNHEQYIAQAIEGVLQQKCDVPFELLIGEDCSTDGTRNVIRQYAEKYPEIIRVLYHETNYRMAGNIVDLVSNARGEFNEYDQVETCSYWRGDKTARESLAYMIGNAILRPIKLLKKWINRK